MTNPLPTPDEIVIRKAGAKEYNNRGWISAWFTLTNQRLIVQRLLGKAVSYPLSHITQISEYEYWPPLVALFSWKILRIDFDNGGTLLVGQLELQTWIQEIQRAKASAPQLPYTTAPSLYTPHITQTAGPTLRWVWMAVFASSVITTCICTPIAWLVFLYLRGR